LNTFGISQGYFFMHLHDFSDYLRHNKRYSSHTVLAYENDLRQYGEFLSENGLNESAEADHLIIRAWVVGLMENGLDSKSVNRKISSLRSFYKYLKRQGLVNHDPMQKISGPKTGRQLPTFIDEAGTQSLFSEVKAGDDFDSWRTYIILELFYRTGMRLSELIGISINDVDLPRLQLRVLGKRNKERIIPISQGFAVILEDYLKRRNELGTENSNAFICLDKGGKCYPKFIYNKVHLALSGLATLEKKSPHILRHTFATQMLNRGADLNSIKEILGHANLSATQVYTHNTIDKLKRVHQQAHPRG
jgi:integrase/recombinase XerC